MSNSIGWTKAQIRCVWLIGRQFDLCFFFAPIVLGFFVFFLAHTSAVAASVFWATVVAYAFGAGPFHQGPTWFVYLDRQNREHYAGSASRRLIFFAAPALIMLASVAGYFLFKPLIAFIWMIWSVQHLVQQNVGILLLYHQHGAGEAIVSRPVEVRSQHACAVFFSLIFFNRVMLGDHLPWLSNAVIAVALAVAVYWAGRYLLEMRRQVSAGAWVNVPAAAFWCLSVLSMSPLAFLGATFEEGFLIPLTVHWFQYIGLNYILVTRKYSTELVQNLPVPRPLILFFLVCSAFVVVNIGLSLLGGSAVLSHAWQRNLAAGTLIGLGMVHYFLDAFLWRFREPFQRQTVLPYLIGGR